MSGVEAYTRYHYASPYTHRIDETTRDTTFVQTMQAAFAGYQRDLDTANDAEHALHGLLQTHIDYQPRAASALPRDDNPHQTPETLRERMRRWYRRTGKEWLKYVGWGSVVSFALFQGIGAGANGSTAIIKALPSLGAVGLGAAQVGVTALGIMGAIMNMYVMIKLMPRTAALLWQFFTNLKKEWRESKRKFALKILAIFGSLCAGAAVGAFTFYSAPMTIIGIMSLFGATAFPPLFGVALALAIVQGLAIFALLFTDAYEKIHAFTWKKARDFFSFKWWPRKGDEHTHTASCKRGLQKKIGKQLKLYKHYMRYKKIEEMAIAKGDVSTEKWANKKKRQYGLKLERAKRQCDEHYPCMCDNLTYRRAAIISRAVAFTLGAALLIGATLFGVVVEGDSFLEMLDGVSDVLKYAATTVVVYLSTGILESILKIATADSVFGMLGEKMARLGAHIYAAFAKPLKTLENIKDAVVENVRYAWTYTKSHPASAAWNVCKYTVGSLFGIFIFANLIGNTIGNAAIGSHGVPGENSHNDMAGKIGDTLKNPNPDLLREYLTTPQGSAMNESQYVATAVSGAESVSVCSHLMLSGDDETLEEGVEPQSMNQPQSMYPDSYSNSGSYSSALFYNATGTEVYAKAGSGDTSLSMPWQRHY